MHVKSTSIHHSLPLMKLLVTFIRHLVAILKFIFWTSQENIVFCFDVLQMQKIDIRPELYHIYDDDITGGTSPPACF